MRESLPKTDRQLPASNQLFFGLPQKNFCAAAGAALKRVGGESAAAAHGILTRPMVSTSTIVADGARRMRRAQSTRRIQILQRTYRRHRRRAKWFARPLLLLWYLQQNLRQIGALSDPRLFAAQKS